MTRIEIQKATVQIVINAQLEKIQRNKVLIAYRLEDPIIDTKAIQNAAMDIAQAQAELDALYGQMQMLERLEESN